MNNGLNMTLSVRNGAKSINQEFLNQEKADEQAEFRRERAHRLASKLIGSSIASVTVEAEQFYVAALGVTSEEGLDEENPEFMSIYMASMVLQHELNWGDTIELRADKSASKKDKHVKLASFSSEYFEPIQFTLRPFIGVGSEGKKWYGEPLLAVEDKVVTKEVPFMKVLTYIRSVEMQGNALRGSSRIECLRTCPLNDQYIQFESGGRVYGRQPEIQTQARVPYSINQ